MKASLHAFGQARKDRNRLILLETDFATGEEAVCADAYIHVIVLVWSSCKADPWEGSEMELLHSSSFVTCLTRALRLEPCFNASKASNLFEIASIQVRGGKHTASKADRPLSY